MVFRIIHIEIGVRGNYSWQFWRIKDWSFPNLQPHPLLHLYFWIVEYKFPGPCISCIPHETCTMHNPSPFTIDFRSRHFRHYESLCVPDLSLCFRKRPSPARLAFSRRARVVNAYERTLSKTWKRIMAEAGSCCSLSSSKSEMLYCVMWVVTPWRLSTVISYASHSPHDHHVTPTKYVLRETFKTLVKMLFVNSSSPITPETKKLRQVNQCPCIINYTEVATVWLLIHSIWLQVNSDSQCEWQTDFARSGFYAPPLIPWMVQEWLLSRQNVEPPLQNWSGVMNQNVGTSKDYWIVSIISWCGTPKFDRLMLDYQPGSYEFSLKYVTISITKPIRPGFNQCESLEIGWKMTIAWDEIDVVSWRVFILSSLFMKLYSSSVQPWNGSAVGVWSFLLLQCGFYIVCHY